MYVSKGEVENSPWGLTRMCARKRMQNGVMQNERRRAEKKENSGGRDTKGKKLSPIINELFMFGFFFYRRICSVLSFHTYSSDSSDDFVLPR